MNACQNCSDLRDAVPFYQSRGLYLKPVAYLHISVQLPQLKTIGKSISHREIMDKLKQRISPEECISLKISKSTSEFIRLDGEIESKCKLPLVLARLDGKLVRISGFSEQLKIRAVETKFEFPMKYDWDSFFRDSKTIHEMKYGERPDTIYLANLPRKWFCQEETKDKPSEKLLKKVFEQFGEVSRVDVPMLDCFRHQMNSNISDYFCFVKAMDTLRGMKLVYMDEKKNAFSANIKIEFDKSKHLSDASVKRRQIIRERLEKKQRLEKEMKKKENEEKRMLKLERRKKREEKCKQKQLEKLKQKEMKNIKEKIAIEEYLLLMAQRKLESIRLLRELINRVKNEKEKELSSKDKTKRNKKISKAEDIDPKMSEIDTEKDLRYKMIQRFKKMQEKQIDKETVKLKSLITEADQLSKNTANISSVSSDTSDIDIHREKQLSRNESDIASNRGINRCFNRNRNDPPCFSKINSEDFPNTRGRFNRDRRGFGRHSYSNFWRGAYQEQYMLPIMDPILLSYFHEYYKYFQKVARNSKRFRHNSVFSRSYSKSRSRSRSCSRSKSRSKGRSYKNSSKSRSTSHRYSRSVSRDSVRAEIKKTDDTPANAIENKIDERITVKKHKKEKKKHKKKKKNVKAKRKKIMLLCHNRRIDNVDNFFVVAFHFILLDINKFFVLCPI